MKQLRKDSRFTWLAALAFGLLMIPLSATAEDHKSIEFKDPASSSQVKVEEAKAAPKFKRFKASIDRFFYEFEGVRASNLKNSLGVSRYGFDRVTFDSNVYSLTYSTDALTSFTVQNSFNTIFAETLFDGEISRDETQGFADTTVKGSKTFINPEGIYVVEAGVVLPTGSITQKNLTARRLFGLNVNYPYNMQLGSGTYDGVVSGTYLKIIGKHQVGTFGMATLRAGKNSEGYRRGDEFLAKTWYGYNLAEYFVPGVWFNYQNIQSIVGRDEDFRDSVSDELLAFYYNPRTFWDITPNITTNYQVTDSLKLKGMLGSPLFQHSINSEDVQLYTQWFIQTGFEGTF